MNTRRAVEELARKRGVVLAGAVPAAAPVAPAAAASSGWLAKPMPKASALMAELKATLDPVFYDAAIDNLKRGAGFVVDESTMIALGWPPVDLYVRGKTERRAGFTIMRVRPKAQGTP
jgi:hypothetical protein